MPTPRKPANKRHHAKRRERARRGEAAYKRLERWLSRHWLPEVKPDAEPSNPQ